MTAWRSVPFDRPLRIGFGALVHIPGFQSAGLEVVAVSARREERAREAATRFGVSSRSWTPPRESARTGGRVLIPRE